MRKMSNSNAAYTWSRRSAGALKRTLGTLAITSLTACTGLIGGSDQPTEQQTGSYDGGVSSCAPANVDPTRYLRQLSLDLRGRPPSLAELEQVASAGDVPAAMIDAMLGSPEFSERAREWHRTLLWPTLDQFLLTATDLIAWDSSTTGARSGGSYSPDPELLDNAAAHPRGVVGFAGNGGGDRALRGGTTSITGCDPTIEYPAPVATGAQPSYTVTGSDGIARQYPYYDTDGVPLPYHDAAHCPNYCSSKSDAERAAPEYRGLAADFTSMSAARTTTSPPAHELDPEGRACPATHPHRMINPCDNKIYNGADVVPRIRREGVRMVRHYWAGSTPIRTCAYEAQDRAASVYTGISCARPSFGDASCGCGPNGSFCMPAVARTSAAASRTQSRVRTAINDEPLQIISSVIERNEDYFDIFTTKRSFVTGPLAYLFRHQTDVVRGFPITAPAADNALPDMAFTDTQWREYVRDPQHAGVLTTAAYLGRFPTWRARVSQFRSAFMCRPFSPASAAVPSPDDTCTREPNMARRCGCQNCHAALEPMTAWFGRWAERSTQYLAPADYPSFDPNCQLCALRGQNCTTRCRQQYVVDTYDANGAEYAGTLRSVLYRTPDEVRRIEEGPEGMVHAALASGELQSCTVKNSWGWLLGRPMNEGEARTILPSLVADFNNNGHNFRALVRAVVTSPAYRRVD